MEMTVKHYRVNMTVSAHRLDAVGVKTNLIVALAMLGDVQVFGVGAEPDPKEPAVFGVALDVAFDIEAEAACKLVAELTPFGCVVDEESVRVVLSEEAA